mgnify:FL=1
MFGYISPDRPYLFIKDETLYKALYCGVCRSISKECGQLARTALTYDIAFMSAIIHNIRGQDVKIVQRRCPVHPIRRRPMTERDNITNLLACVNTALAYHKLSDDKADGDARGVLRFLYNKGYKKVLAKHPDVAEIISAQMGAQAALEKDKCAIIDMACEPTAAMMAQLSRYALGEFATEYTDGLFYAIGKWIYLADALDDYDKDVKKGRYNVLYLNYGTATKKQAVAKGEAELVFIFDSLFADMRRCLANIKFYFNHDLTDNIILRGIPLKTRQMVYGACQNGRTEKKNEEVQS